MFSPPFVVEANCRGAGWWYVLRVQGDPTEADEIERDVPRWTGLWPRDWGEVDQYDDSRLVAAYGWPAVALSARREPPIGQLGKQGPIPLFPVWRGLLADTLVFATAIAFAHRSPTFVRDWLRRRRGKCARCGYDLTGIAACCPECGHAFSNRRATTW